MVKSFLIDRDPLVLKPQNLELIPRTYKHQKSWMHMLQTLAIQASLLMSFRPVKAMSEKPSGGRLHTKTSEHKNIWSLHYFDTELKGSIVLLASGELKESHHLTPTPSLPVFWVCGPEWPDLNVGMNHNDIVTREESFSGFEEKLDFLTI